MRLLPCDCRSILCAMIGTRTDEECVNDLYDVKGSHAPGHSGRLALNFFRPVNEIKTDQESSHPQRQGSFWEVYTNTAGAFRDVKRTVQGLVPWPLRHFSSFVYNVVTFNTRAQDLFKHDTNHFRECVRANVSS